MHAPSDDTGAELGCIASCFTPGVNRQEIDGLSSSVHGVIIRHNAADHEAGVLDGSFVIGRECPVAWN